MGELDIRAKDFFGQPEVFADVLNYLEYKGEEVYRSSTIRPLDPKEKVPPAKELQRDLLRYVELSEKGETYSLIRGFEIQTQVDYGMPARILAYDGLRYYELLRERGVAKENRERPFTS